jgi:hypothetical protein
MLEGESVTSTIATDAVGGGAIVSVAAPDFPSLVAMIVTVPAATALTKPVDETVARLTAVEVHVTVRPVSTWPDASYSVAVPCVLWPTLTLYEFSVTTTLATGEASAVTVTATGALTPPDVAVTVALPALTAVTTPVDDTVATAELLDAHVTTRLVITVPLASLGDAKIVAVLPTFSESDDGETDSETAVGVVTVRDVDVLSALLVALIVTVPTLRPVATPDELMLATAELELDQVTVWPVIS